MSRSPLRLVPNRGGTAVLLSTASSPREGRRLARLLVNQRAAACVSVVPGMHSIYWWNGTVEEGEEVLLIIKTRRARLLNLCRVLRRHHSYDLPELLLLPPSDGEVSYLQWLKSSLNENSKRP